MEKKTSKVHFTVCELSNSHINSQQSKGSSSVPVHHQLTLRMPQMIPMFISVFPPCKKRSNSHLNSKQPKGSSSLPVCHQLSLRMLQMVPVLISVFLPCRKSVVQGVLSFSLLLSDAQLALVYSFLSFIWQRKHCPVEFCHTNL